MEKKIFQHAYNLIQNFYVIGISKKNNTLISKILSKFPADLPYLNIDDEIIINVSIINNVQNIFIYLLLYSIVFQMDYK